jgi:FlgD Ig-like domain
MYKLVLFSTVLLLLLGFSSLSAAIITVELKDGSGAYITSGATLKYYDGAWKTDATNHGDGTWTINTAVASLYYEVTYNYGKQQVGPFPSSMGTVTFQTTSTTVRLETATGTGLNGGVAGYHQGAWNNVGTTDGTGNTAVLELLPGSYYFNMVFNNGKQQIGPLTVSGTSQTVTFITTATTVRLENCSHSGLSGGAASYHQGAWNNFGTTDGTGNTAVVELLPGSYYFKMLYNYGQQQIGLLEVSGTAQTITFQTTTVTVGGPGITEYYQSAWHTFTSPIDLLPDSYYFRIGGSQVGPLAVSGCTKSYVLLAVKDENNNGVPGGKATPAYGGSWGATLSGQTDANGKLFSEIPPGYTKIKMAVNQGGAEQSLAQLNASGYTWTTQILRIWLKDHNGSAITDGQGSLDQGGGYWYAWGNLNASGYRDIQLFAGNYKFKMTYNYTSQEKFPVVAVNAGIDNFDFQTGQVISNCGHTQYSTGAWRTFTSGMELMPGTYTFRYPSQSGAVVAGEITTLCTNVNSSIKAVIGSTNYYDSGSNQVRVEIAIKNISSAPIYGPLITKFKTLTPGPPTITIPNADGGGNGIGCYYNYSSLLGGDNQLDPGETTGYKLWIFQENVRPPVNFKFFADVFGHLDGIPKAADSGQEQPVAFLFDVQRGAVEENSIAEQDGNVSEIPETYALHQNHPNPFNPTTTLQFDLPEAGEVTLKIYNSVGQLVRTLVSGDYEAGAHNVIWDARNDSDMPMASGVYLAVFRVGGVQQVRRLVLMK